MHIFICSLVSRQKEKQIMERKNSNCLMSKKIKPLGAWFNIPTKVPIEIVIPKNSTMRMMNFLFGF